MHDQFLFTKGGTISLKWSHLTKVILQGTIEGKQRIGRPEKMLADNIKDWTSKSFIETQALVRITTQQTGVEIADEEVRHGNWDLQRHLESSHLFFYGKCFGFAILLAGC